MEFYTAIKENRPVRLSEATRQFAFDSLNGKYGREVKMTPSVSLDGIEDITDKNLFELHDLALIEIAKKAPVRICEGELISGSATLGEAINHVIPATLNGKIILSGMSHVTFGFDKAVKLGINSYEQLIKARLVTNPPEDQAAFLKSLLNCIKSMHIWHGRYRDAVKDINPEIYNNLSQVPFEAPRSFYEAVQSLWFLFAFTRLSGNWSGIGRIDCILGEYLKSDLENNVLNIERAREILAHFLIKGCEWVTGGSNGSGDAQHYQNIVLSGIDGNGTDITNEVTYLTLDVIEELGISDFPIAVRLNGNSPDKLLTRIAEVTRHGGGVVAVYNEPLIIESMTAFGYTLNEARNFANDGCWEVQVPGKTYFTYYPFDSLQILQNKTLKLNSDETVVFDSYEELCDKYKSDLKAAVFGIIASANKVSECWKDYGPLYAVASLFTEDCIDKGRSYFAGGPVYNIISPHIGGLPDTANSLYAIKKAVFDEKKLPLADFLNILKNDWEGQEPLRQYILNKYDYYGNDNDEADAIAAKLLDFFADASLEKSGQGGILNPPGVSTFGRQIDWAPLRKASPHGRKASEILSGNLSPTPGTEKEGATAIIKSYCKAFNKKLSCGAALDIKLYPTVVEGKKGVEDIKSLIQGFLKLGGFFMQLDVTDNEILKLAKEHPENYKHLAVRISGWSARFVTLDENWQKMIIERTASKI